MIEIDGSHGEGGGQIVRSALSLSLCTGQPCRVFNIRAGREKPGLMRQHLTAVRAAAEISGAQVTGDEIGSTAITFRPGRVEPGNYSFSIGTAGSCTLVLQTVLPPLLTAGSPSFLTISGGTHNRAAPPVDFLQRTFLPLLSRMGASVSMQLIRYGFFPRGGGQITVAIDPVPHLRPIELVERGASRAAYAEAYFAGIPMHVAERELAVVGGMLNWDAEQLKVRGLAAEAGPGNALTVSLEYDNVCEVFTGFGEKGVAAESVATRTGNLVRDYLASNVVACRHLADQLLLPMVLAKAGAFTTFAPTPHFESNCEVISRFTGARITRTENAGAFLIEIR